MDGGERSENHADGKRPGATEEKSAMNGCTHGRYGHGLDDDDDDVDNSRTIHESKKQILPRKMITKKVFETKLRYSGRLLRRLDQETRWKS